MPLNDSSPASRSHERPANDQQAVAERAIRAFPFWDYGLNGVDPKSEYAEWVPDLATAVITATNEPVPETP
ncbi:hypothetical protein ETD86_29460 [Nonomuraea turkmeniaca]|uniref:Uncharacterized protein n=1 Tax=Nonomuraea turkmeniaca TaxID=103838 RepID=A0A5S4FA35_9ACTN|nr:hypothetical protein [Nonomuraea turkmeniaca]TMR14076.1 hypothetical protein ETD86_29460 [Nonomuraea turkmeniaca]